MFDIGDTVKNKTTKEKGIISRIYKYSLVNSPVISEKDFIVTKKFKERIGNDYVLYSHFLISQTLSSEIKFIFKEIKTYYEIIYKNIPHGQKMEIVHTRMLLVEKIKQDV